MISQSTTVGISTPPSSVVPPVGLPMGKGVWVLWGVLAVVMTVLGYLYADSLRFLVQAWLEDDNYSHGPFIPLISLYLVWLRWTQLKTVERRGAWWGLPIIIVGLLMYAVGEFAAMYAVVHVSLWTGACWIDHLCRGHIGRRPDRLSAVLSCHGDSLAGIPSSRIVEPSPVAVICAGRRLSPAHRCDGLSRRQCDRSGADPTSSGRSLQRTPLSVPPHGPHTALRLSLPRISLEAGAALSVKHADFDSPERLSDRRDRRAGRDLWPRRGRRIQPFL